MTQLLPLTAQGERFLMVRTRMKFDVFGIDMDPDAVIELLIEQFNSYVRGQMTIDELLLHPREALSFCDTVRRSQGWYDLPDHMILRPILTRRKNPAD